MRKIKFYEEGFRATILFVWFMATVVSFMFYRLFAINGFSIIASLIFIVPTAIGVIYATIWINKIANRTKLALAGKKSTAIVREVKPVYGGKYNTHVAGFMIHYEYKAESGEKIMRLYQVSVLDSRHFIEGNSIPIYLNGDYGCFKICDILKLEKNEKDENKNKEDFFICPYCDSRVSNSNYSCPNCGARR